MFRGEQSKAPVGSQASYSSGDTWRDNASPQGTPRGAGEGKVSRSTLSGPGGPVERMNVQVRALSVMDVEGDPRDVPPPSKPRIGQGLPLDEGQVASRPLRHAGCAPETSSTLRRAKYAEETLQGGAARVRISQGPNRSRPA